MTVYNQSMIMGGNTLDKRHADFNDELGYIAPPNRKLPPVPGSNYNTCDRIKRGVYFFSYLNYYILLSMTVFFLLFLLVLYNLSSLDFVFISHLTIFFLFSSHLLIRFSWSLSRSRYMEP